MKTIVKIIALCVVTLVVSCNSEPSLQKYYVNHQNDPNFTILDISRGLLLNELDSLPDDLAKSLKSIRKANILALPLNGKNQEQYEKERQKVSNILTSGDYKLLAMVNFSGNNVQLRYLGDEQHIDEFVLMAYNDEKGFVVARLLGDQMNPQDLWKIIKAVSTGETNFNLKGLEGMKNIFE